MANSIRLNYTASEINEKLEKAEDAEKLRDELLHDGGDNPDENGIIVQIATALDAFKDELMNEEYGTLVQMGERIEENTFAIEDQGAELTELRREVDDLVGKSVDIPSVWDESPTVLCRLLTDQFMSMAGYEAKKISVKGGDVVYIKGGASSSGYIVLTDFEERSGWTTWADSGWLASGWTRREQSGANASKSYVIPEDAQYILVATVQGANDTTPAEMTINGNDVFVGQHISAEGVIPKIQEAVKDNAEAIEGLQSDVEKVKSDVEPLINGGEPIWDGGEIMHIRMFGKTTGYVKVATYQSNLIDVKAGDVVKAFGNSGQKVLIAVLKDKPSLPSSTTTYDSIIASGDNFIELAIGESNNAEITTAQDAKYILVHGGADGGAFPSALTINGEDVFSPRLSAIDRLEGKIRNNSADIVTIKDKIFPQTMGIEFCKNVDPNVLVELYLPNAESGWKIAAFGANTKYFLISINNGTSSIIFKEGRDDYPIGTNYSRLVHSLVDGNTGELYGYVVINFNGSDYASGGGLINIENVKNIDNCPKIKEYLSREGNIVLLGDSIVGSGVENILAPFIINETDKKVFNGGMAGCRMAWLTPDGSNDYDGLTFVSIADAIDTDDWSKVETSARAKMTGDAPYLKRASDIKRVDFTKPTTLIVEYCNNDITSAIPIGNLWQNGDTEESFAKNTLLGAMNYGAYKILKRYPLTRIIFFTPAWRYMKDKNNEYVAPYAFVNGANLSFADYRNAIIENANRIGVSVYDFSYQGGRNEINRDTTNGVLIDNSHFNVLGYKMMARTISKVVDSDLS